MIECQKLGLTKSIGVCNFNRRQLQALLDGSSVKPATLQVSVCSVSPNITIERFTETRMLSVQF